MNHETMTMGELLGEEARDTMVAYAESKTTAQVEKERRRAQFEADLVKRMDQLVAWNRSLTQEMVKVRGANGYWTVQPAANPCVACARLRAHLETVGVAPKGLVVFTADLPLIDRAGLGVERHDRYHLEVAYTAVRKEEYEARVARRHKQGGNNHKAFAPKAVRLANTSDSKRAERHWAGIVAARTQGKGQDNASRVKARQALEAVLAEAGGDYTAAVKLAKKKGLNKKKD